MLRSRFLFAQALFLLVAVLSAFSAGLPPEVDSLLVQCFEAGEWPVDTPPAAISTLQNLVDRNDEEMRNLFKKKAVEIGGAADGEKFMNRVASAVDKNGLDIAESLASQAAAEANRKIPGSVEVVIRTGSSGNRHMNIKDPAKYPKEGTYTILSSDDDISFLGPNGKEAADTFNDLKAKQLKNARCKGFALSPLEDGTYELLVQQMADGDAFIGTGFAKIKQEMIEKGGAVILQSEGAVMSQVHIPVKEFVEKNLESTLAQIMDMGKIAVDLKTMGPMTMYASCIKQMALHATNEREKLKYLLRIYAAMEAAGSFSEAAGMGARQATYFKEMGQMMMTAYNDKSPGMTMAKKFFAKYDFTALQTDAFESVMLSTCRKLQGVIKKAEAEASEQAWSAVMKQPEVKRMINELGAAFALIDQVGHRKVLQDVIPKMLQALRNSGADNMSLLYRILFRAAQTGGMMSVEAGIENGLKTWLMAGSPKGLIEGMAEAGPAGKETRLLLAEAGGERLAGKAGTGAKQFKKILEEGNGDSFLWKMLSSETSKKFAAEALCNAPFVMLEMYSAWQKGDMKDLSDAAVIVVEFVPAGMTCKKAYIDGMSREIVLLAGKDMLLFSPLWPYVLAADVLKLSWDVAGAIQIERENEGLVELLVYNGKFVPAGGGYKLTQLELPGQDGQRIPRDDIHKWMFNTKYVLIKTATTPWEQRINNLSERANNIFDVYYMSNDPALSQMRAAVQDQLDRLHWDAAGQFIKNTGGPSVFNLPGAFAIWMGQFDIIVRQNKNTKWDKLYTYLKLQVENRREVVIKDWMVPQLISLAEAKYATLNAPTNLAPQLAELQKKIEAVRGGPLGVDLVAKVTEQAKSLSDALDSTGDILFGGVKNTAEKKMTRGEYWQAAFKTYQSIYDKNVTIPATIEGRTGYGRAKVFQFVWTGNFASETNKSEQSRAGFAHELSHITADINKIKGSVPDPYDDVDKTAFDILGTVVFPWREALDKEGLAAPVEGTKYFEEYEVALEKVRALYGQNKDFNALLKKGAELLVTPASVPIYNMADVELIFRDATLAKEYAAGNIRVTWSCKPAGLLSAGESKLIKRFRPSRPEPVLITAMVSRTGPLKGFGKLIRMVEILLPDNFLTLDIEPFHPQAGGEFTATAGIPRAFYGTEGNGFHYRWSAESCTVANQNRPSVRGMAPQSGGGSVQVELWVDGVLGQPIILAQRKASFTVQSGQPAFELVVNGPPKTPVKSSITVTAVLQTADPSAAKAADEITIEWLEDGKVIATGPRWTPNTAKAHDYRVTVQGVLGKGKSKQPMAKTRYVLVVTDKDKPDDPKTEDPLNKTTTDGLTGESTTTPPVTNGTGKVETPGTNAPVSPELIAAAYANGGAMAAEIRKEEAMWEKPANTFYGKGRMPTPAYARHPVLSAAWLRGYDEAWVGKSAVPPKQADLKNSPKPLFTTEYTTYNETKTGDAAVKAWIEAAYADGYFSGSQNIAAAKFYADTTGSPLDTSKNYKPEPTGWRYASDPLLKSAYMRGYNDAFAGKASRPPTEAELGGGVDVARVQLQVSPILPRLKLRDSVQIQAVVSNIKPEEQPLIYQWTGDVIGTGAKVGFTATQSGATTLAVAVTGTKGPIGQASVTFDVAALEAILTGVPTGPVVVGSPVKLGAQLTSGGQPATGSYWIQWQPHPNVQFEPFESGTRTDTVATFPEPGKIAVWFQVLKKEGAALKILVESEQVEIEVVEPTLNLTAQPASPYVGQEVTLTVKEEPAVPDDLITFWWDKQGDALNAGPLQKERQYTLIPKDTRPVTVTAHGKGRKDGAILGEASLTLTAQPYGVQVSTPRRLGPPPRVWSETAKQLVDAPADAIGTFQDVSLSASITPEPPGQPLRYQWSIEPDGGTLSSPVSRDTRANASQKGTYQVSVQISDKNGLLLGSGSGSFSVTVSQDDQSDAAKAKQAAAKLSQAQAAVAGGRLEEGISLAGEAAALYPKNTEAARLQAKWTSERQAVLQRISELRAALRKPDLQQAAALLAAARQLHPRYAPVIEAGAEYDRAVAAEKEKEAKIARLTAEGEALAKQDKLAEAIAKFKEALALKPDTTLQQRIEELNALLAKNEKIRQLLAGGFEFEKAGDLAKAIANYREALALKDDPKVNAHIAELEKKLADREQAKRLVNEGYALEKKEQYAAAIAKYQAALALFDQPGVKTHIAELEALIASKTKALVAEGYAAEKNGDRIKALAKYRAAQALKADPRVAAHIAELEKQASSEAATTQKRAAREAEAAALVAAGNEFEKANDPANAIAKYRAAQTIQDDSRVAARITELEGVLAKSRKAAEWLAKGYQFEQAKSWKNALSCYESAQQESPNPKVDERIRYVKAQLQAMAAASARSLTGVFKSTFRNGNESGEGILTLKQNGDRVTGSYTLNSPALAKPITDPVNLVLRGNQLVPVDKPGEKQSLITVSPDYNSITLSSPSQTAVFKRVN